MKRLFYFNLLLVFLVVCACSHSVFYYSKYSVTIKNSEGKTALDYAEEAYKGNLLDLLKKERT